MAHVYCFTGYPGAGKSVASSVAEDMDIPTIAMGDVVRERARNELGADATSSQIGDWATEQRDAHGATVIAEWTADAIDDLDAETVVIDGLRTEAEAEVFRDRFDDVTVVYVSADFDERLRRLRSRGREDEAEFTAADLRARDATEANWGLDDLIGNERYDVELPNNGALAEATAAVRDLLR